MRTLKADTVILCSRVTRVMGFYAATFALPRSGIIIFPDLPLVFVMPPVNINCNALLYLPEPNEKLYSEYTQMKLGDSKYQVISDRAHGSSDTAHAHDRN